MKEDKMVGWNHQFNGHEFEQAMGVGDGQGSLACCRPWGPKESDTIEQLNELNSKQPKEKGDFIEKIHFFPRSPKLRYRWVSETIGTTHTP